MAQLVHSLLDVRAGFANDRSRNQIAHQELSNHLWWHVQSCRIWGCVPGGPLLQPPRNGLTCCVPEVSSPVDVAAPWLLPPACKRPMASVVILQRLQLIGPTYAPSAALIYCFMSGTSTAGSCASPCDQHVIHANTQSAKALHTGKCYSVAWLILRGSRCIVRASDAIFDSWQTRKDGKMVGEGCSLPPRH